MHLYKSGSFEDIEDLWEKLPNQWVFRDVSSMLDTAFPLELFIVSKGTLRHRVDSILLTASHSGGSPTDEQGPGNHPMGFPGGLVVKNPPANAEDTGDTGSASGSGRFPGVGNGNPLQYSCQEKFHGQRSLAGCSL